MVLTPYDLFSGNKCDIADIAENLEVSVTVLGQQIHQKVKLKSLSRLSFSLKGQSNLNPSKSELYHPRPFKRYLFNQQFIDTDESFSNFWYIGTLEVR